MYNYHSKLLTSVACIILLTISACSGDTGPDTSKALNYSIVKTEANNSKYGVQTVSDITIDLVQDTKTITPEALAHTVIKAVIKAQHENPTECATAIIWPDASFVRSTEHLAIATYIPESTKRADDPRKEWDVQTVKVNIPTDKLSTLAGTSLEIITQQYKNYPVE